MNPVDAALIAGIADDLNQIDGLCTLRFFHVDSGEVDMATGKYHSAVTETVVESCLFRADAERLTSSTRQIQQRLESIQNDVMTVADTVVEVPMEFAPRLRQGDTCVQIVDGAEIGPRYLVVSRDACALNTRLRLGCRRLV